MKTNKPSDRSPARPHEEIAASVAQPSVPAHWQWHYQRLGKLREQLQEQQRQRLQQGAEPLERHSMHPADSASGEFDQEMVLSQLAAEQDTIYEMEEAQRRILAGTYGICERTGRPIPADRLKAVPWTRFVAEVGASLERAGHLQRLHLGELRSVQRDPAAALAAGETALEAPEPAAPEEPPLPPVAS